VAARFLVGTTCTGQTQQIRLRYFARGYAGIVVSGKARQFDMPYFVVLANFATALDFVLIFISFNKLSVAYADQSGRAV
jgi:hypothetical protein